MPNFLEIKLAIFYVQFYKFCFLQFCPMYVISRVRSIFRNSQKGHCGAYYPAVCPGTLPMSQVTAVTVQTLRTLTASPAGACNHLMILVLTSGPAPAVSVGTR